MASSSLSVIPSSSKSSGSAFDTPRINLSKVSSKLLPREAEAFLAPSVRETKSFVVNPLAAPIAAACAACSKRSIPSEAV